MVYTGPGRNLPAAGQVFRALGRGFRVRVLSPGTGRCGCAELASSGRFGDRIELNQPAREEPAGASRERTEGRQLAQQALNSRDFHMVVLEELEDLVRNSDISMQEIEDLLAQRPSDLHVLITVGEATAGLISAADLVTEVACVKGEAPGPCS